MSGKKLKIVVHELIGDDSAVMSEDGNKLFERIEKALDKDISVQISFQNISLITTAFLNAGIGQLYGKYSSEILNEKLEIVDMDKSDLEILKKVIKVSKKYFENKDQLSKKIDEELGDDN